MKFYERHDNITFTYNTFELTSLRSYGIHYTFDFQYRQCIFYYYYIINPFATAVVDEWYGFSVIKVVNSTDWYFVLNNYTFPKMKRNKAKLICKDPDFAVCYTLDGDRFESVP